MNNRGQLFPSMSLHALNRLAAGSGTLLSGSMLSTTKYVYSLFNTTGDNIMMYCSLSRLAYMTNQSVASLGTSM